MSATLRGESTTLDVDRIIVATGFRPDTQIFNELRIALDPTVEAPARLAPLIDPNLHSCGTVPPHGAAELAHPEPGFYIAGAKSYGRAPTFLMMTGYEQVRSIVAEIAGDHEAAREVRLVLPETGVCITDSQDAQSQTCCGDRHRLRLMRAASPMRGQKRPARRVAPRKRRKAMQALPPRVVAKQRDERKG